MVKIILGHTLFNSQPYSQFLGPFPREIGWWTSRTKKKIM